jgi:hypothetical protein
MTLCDNHVTHTHIHIQCNPRTFHMHNKYDKRGNKHAQFILISEYNIFIHNKYLNVNTYI